MRQTALDTLPLPTLIRQATETCQKRLDHKLAHEVESVSCPFCGFIQREMAVELRRRFLKPLRTAGIYLICATSGLAIAAASAGIYVRGTPRIPSMDTNWFGLSGAALVGVAFGFLLIVLRWFLGGLRYSGEGFVANRAIGAGLLTTKGTTTQLRRAG